MKPIHAIPAALSAIVLALAAGSADAQVTNGNFNGLSGWSTDGDAAAASSGGNHLVLTNAYPGGIDDADGIDRNVSGTAPDSTGGSLEGFLGLPANALDTSPTLQAYEGSAAMQTFTAAAGSQLSFQWNLATAEAPDATTPDVAFVVIDGQLITLGNTLAATNASSGGGNFVGQTGWADWSTTLTGSGPHTIAFGVVDIGSFTDSSELLVTGVSTASAVPESSTLAMFGAGLALLALQRRRRNA